MSAVAISEGDTMAYCLDMTYHKILVFKNQSTASIEEFKSAVNGVYLFYELADAYKTTYTSDLYYKTGEDTYIPLEEVWPAIGQCCNWASENLIEQDDDAQGQPQSITPMTTEVFQSDLKELLKTIGDTYISKEQTKDSFDNLLSTINTNSGTALGGSYATNGFNDDGSVKFIFTPNT